MTEELLCIDTNVMIWGILKNGKTEEEKHMIQKASSFFSNGFNEGKIFTFIPYFLKKRDFLTTDERYGGAFQKHRLCGYACLSRKCHAKSKNI